MYAYNLLVEIGAAPLGALFPEDDDGGKVESRLLSIVVDLLTGRFDLLIEPWTSCWIVCPVEDETVFRNADGVLVTLALVFPLLLTVPVPLIPPLELPFC